MPRIRCWGGEAKVEAEVVRDGTQSVIHYRGCRLRDTDKGVLRNREKRPQ